MNETTNPNSNSNIARPNGDNRLHTSAAGDQQGVTRAAAVNPAAAAGTLTPGSAAATTPRTFTPATPTATAPSSSSASSGTSSPASAGANAPALLDKVVQGAHQTVDRIAETAAPVVERLGERVAATEDAVMAKTEQLRQAGEKWTAAVRNSVSGNPLISVAGALLVGALFARMTRKS